MLSISITCIVFLHVYRLVCIVLSISSFPTWEGLPIILKFCLIDRLNLLCYRFIDVWLIAYSSCDWNFQMKASFAATHTSMDNDAPPSLHTHTHYPPRRCHILFFLCEIRLEHLSWSVKCLTSYFPTSKHQKSSNNCCWRTQKKNTIGKKLSEETKSVRNISRWWIRLMRSKWVCALCAHFALISPQQQTTGKEKGSGGGRGRRQAVRAV